MADSFVAPKSERTDKLYGEASSPTEIYELAMKELHQLHGTAEGPAATAAVQRAASTPAQDRPAAMRGQHYWRKMYHGNSCVEIATDDETEFNQQVETFTKMGYV